MVFSAIIALFTKILEKIVGIFSFKPSQSLEQEGSKMSHLPMSEKTISVIKATAPVVAPQAHKITETFYPILFRDYPIALDFFNKPTQNQQTAALGDAVIAYASNIDNLGVLAGAVQKINERHCAFGVTPDLYVAVHDSLLKAIVEVLGDAVTPEVGDAWSKAILALAEICWTAEEELYKAAEGRKGGWRMFRDFELVEKTNVGEDTVAFDFKASDGYADGFQYDAGQYLTIKVADGEQKLLRRYTVTSKPGDALLQCTTRLVKGKDGAPDGAMSSFMHSDKFVVGTKVQLAAPFGGYSAKGLGLEDGAPVAFVTAGIGATPAIALSQEGAVGVRGALHVDRSAEYGRELANKIESGHVEVQSVFGESRQKVAELITAFGGEHKDCDFICCGPLGFMKSAMVALAEAGIEDGKIHCEMFGPGNVKK
mmetsp:Transcript_39063/g.83377  ORF Transcript_39063/g.83377 Transcript_39063/m.83377 type:complete len:426 (+) Transcript_39063:132-1409(+)